MIGSVQLARSWPRLCPLQPVIKHDEPVVTAVERHSFPRPLSRARCLASTVDRLIERDTVCSITANCWFCSRMMRCHVMPSPGQSIDLPSFCWALRTHTHTHMSAGGQTDATSGMFWLVPIYNHASNESVLTCVLATVYLVRQRYYHRRDIFRKWQGGSSDIDITRTGRQPVSRPAAHHAASDRIQP